MIRPGIADRLLTGLVLLLLLTGCAAKKAENPVPPSPPPAEETPVTTPVPIYTPKPIPELQFPDGSVHKSLERRLDLSTLTHEELDSYLALLRQMPKLRYIKLGEERPDRSFSWADMQKLRDVCPNVEFDYSFTLFGKHFTTLDTEMNFHHITMEDEGAAVREVLPFMSRCRLLDMDFTGVSSAHMAEIRDAYPDVKVVWRIWFGANCSVRTDVERILASNLDHHLTDENTQDLKYCTKVRFLDVGHNTLLEDFSFLSCMPDLEVAIICLTGLKDLSPISVCTKLEYLEINTLYEGQGLDISPLGTLVNLEHLDMCRLGEVKGWKALKNLTKLKRLWIGALTNLPEGAREELEEALPDTVINWDTYTGSDDTWRFTESYNGYNERYALLRRQFEYSDYTNVSSAWYNDPLYYKEGEPRYRPELWW